MIFSLSTIEKHVGRTIFNRGKDYFESGAVVHLEEIDEGEYEAQVEGSETYEVQVSLNGEQVVDYECDCPYEDGTCKHVVATLLAIQEEREEGEEFIPVATTKPKKKTAADEVDEVLERMDEAQVKEYLREQCLADSEFRRNFLWRFQRLVAPMGKAQFKAQAEAIMRAGGGRHGYLEYRESRTIAGKMMGMLDEAREYLEAKDFAPAFYAATAVLEKMSEAMQYADDSHGEVSGCMQEAMNVLDEMAGMASLSEEIRKEALAYCCEAFLNDRFENDYGDTDMFHLTGQFTRTAEEGEQIIRLATAQGEPDHHVILELIERYQGKAAAANYLQAHLEVSSFRQQAIHSAIEGKDYALAMQLAQQGYQNDKDEKPGLANDWLKLQLEIAQKLHDTTKTIALARQLFLDSYHERMKYYALLKKVTPQAEWPAYVDALIVDLKKGNHNENVLPEIYIAEGWLDHLMAYVKRQNHIYALQQYEHILLPKYRTEFVQMYEKRLIEHLKYCNGRSDYAKACEYLRKMKQLGGHDETQAMIKFIREEFAKRPAFMDELKRV